MKKIASVILVLLLLAGTAFADSPKDAPKEADAQPAKAQPAKPAAAKSSAEIAAEVEELRQVLQSQQEQLQLMKEELAKRDRQIETAREAAASANSRAPEATVKATDAVATSAELKTTTTALNSAVSTMAASNAVIAKTPSAASGQEKSDDKGPTTIRFKGVNITPGGFLDASTVNRQRALSADINTPFNAIPFSGNGLGRLTEMNMSGRHSRLSLLFEGKVGETKLSGYYEADFLGAGTTSNNRQSNSYVFRQRQLWARADFSNGWAVSAGQMWGLVTENIKGIVNRQEWTPLVPDPQYVVGFTWQRAYAARVTKTFGDKFTLAASIENADETIGGRGFSTYTSTSAIGAVTTFQNAFVFAPGSSGGLYNAFDPTGYPANETPDFIVKAAFDPGFGHYEVFGVVSTFRNRVYPCAVVGTTAGNFPMPAVPVELGCSASTSFTPSAAGAYNSSSTGGAVGVSGRMPLFSKKLSVGAKGFYGDGAGRYASAQLADATLRPDGTISLIHNASWLGSIEWHATPRLDIYGYVGGEYAGRSAYTGYQSVRLTTTPAIPGCGGVGQAPCPGGGIQPPYPGVTTTSISTSGTGGYGSPFANNSGCSTETSPTGTSAPGAGGTCAGDTRYIGESTLGFWYKFYQGEKGRVQFGMQYSYFYRNTWSGAAGIAPHAVDNMVWTSFRYYLP